MFAVRDSLYNIRYDEVSDFLPAFLERALSSPLSQEELIYIFTARLPKSYSVELRKSPPASVFEAIKLVRRILEATSAGRPSPSFGKPSSEKAHSHSQLNSLRTPGEKGFQVPTSVAGEMVTATLDTGATDSFVSWSLVRRLRLKYTMKGHEVSLADGLTVTSKGYADTPVSVDGGPTVRVRLWLLGDLDSDLVLGMSWFQVAKPKVNWQTLSVSWDN